MEEATFLTEFPLTVRRGAGITVRHALCNTELKPKITTLKQAFMAAIQHKCPVREANG